MLSNGFPSPWEWNKVPCSLQSSREPWLTASSPITLPLLIELCTEHTPTQGSILSVPSSWNALVPDIHMPCPLPASSPCLNGVNQRGLLHLPYKGETPSLVLLYSLTLYVALFFFTAHIPFGHIIYYVAVVYCFSPPVEHSLHENRILFCSLLKSVYTVGIQINICLIMKEGRKEGTLEASFFLSLKSSGWVRYSLKDPSSSNVLSLYQVSRGQINGSQLMYLNKASLLRRPESFFTTN